MIVHQAAFLIRCYPQVSLEESYNPQIALDVFKEDPNFQQSEKEYEVSHSPPQESLEMHTGAAQLLLAPQDVSALPGETSTPMPLGCAPV